MTVRLLTSAFNDLVAGREFYERQGAGMGGYFLDSLFSDIDSLALYGGIHPKIFGYHRLLAHRFPCAIYYKQVSASEIVVYRILDCRRDPAKISRALRGRST